MEVKVIISVGELNLLEFGFLHKSLKPAGLGPHLTPEAMLSPSVLLPFDKGNILAK